MLELKDCRQLTFILNGGDYGFPIYTVNEVIGLVKITHVPNTPSFIKGIINLRGKIMPVMDLRLKFGMPESEYNERTCIIIVSVKIKGEQKTMGVVVDRISEVIDIKLDDVEAPPQYGAKDSVSFLMGIGKFKEKVIMLLNIDEVVSGEDIASFFKQAPKESLAKV